MATATATKRVMVMVAMVVGDKEGNGNGGKSNGDATRVAGKQIDVALINYRIFLAIIFSLQPKWINPLYRRGVGI
jgi:hypothetical protein